MVVKLVIEILVYCICIPIATTKYKMLYYDYFKSRGLSIYCGVFQSGKNKFEDFLRLNYYIYLLYIYKKLKIIYMGPSTGCF